MTLYRSYSAAAVAPLLPRVEPGTVLELRRDEWKHSDGPLRLRVTTMRADLARFYENQWVWIEGDRLAPDGTPRGWFQALVDVDAVRRQVAAVPGRRRSG